MEGRQSRAPNQFHDKPRITQLVTQWWILDQNHTWHCEVWQVHSRRNQGRQASMWGLARGLQNPAAACWQPEANIRPREETGQGLPEALGRLCWVGWLQAPHFDDRRERWGRVCTYAAAVRAGSELGQTGVCRRDRLQDLTIRCEEKQQEKRGRGWAIRPKTKSLSLVPAPCKTHEPHVLLLSSYLCHSEKYGSHVRGIWIPSWPGL